jgi:hypothetical protein
MAIHEQFGKNFNRISDEDNLDELIGLPDFGCIHQYSPEGIRYYFCVEVSKQMANENTITIPAGTYFFRQDKASKIENALEIFKEHIAGRRIFMIIETEEPFLSKTKINQPMYELRLIIL